MSTDLTQKKIGLDEWKRQHKEKLAARREEIKSKNQRSGGKKFEKTANSLRMEYWSPGETSEWVSIGQDWYEYFTVWVSTPRGKRPVICNCHDGRHDVPCVPCYDILTREQNPSEDDSNENKPSLPFPKEATTVIRKRWFHKVKRISKAGNEYQVYVECKGKNAMGKSVCDLCDQGVERVFGQRRHWTVGTGHKRQVTDALEDISQRCASCGDGIVIPVAYACPSCGHVHVDLQETVLAEEEELFFKNEEMECDACGTKAIAKEELRCIHLDDDDEAVPGCDSPVRVDTTKIDVKIKTQGKGALLIEDWRPSKHDDKLADWVKRPYDFQKFFRYADLDDQAKTMSKPNPFTEEAQEFLVNYVREEAQQKQDHTEAY